MEPLIQYATTADGVSIAFWVIGSGPPLIHLPALPLSNLQSEWQMPVFRNWFERFAETHTVIHFDSRGTGLSEREVADLSLDAHLLDIQAVMQRAGFARSDIFASSYSGPIGIRFAALHPEAISRLVLWCTHARHNEVTERMDPRLNEQRIAVNRLADVDFELFIRTYLHRAIGWTEGDVANQFAALARASIEPDRFVNALGQYAAFDAVDDLATVTTPTLILHRPDFVGSNVNVAKSLAARIPNARLVLLNGDSIVPFIGDTDQVIKLVTQFCADGVQAVPQGDMGANNGFGGLRTVLFVELDDVDELFRARGDAATREVLRQHDRRLRDAVARFGGGDIKAMGEAAVASFGSAAMAIECAIELQRASWSAGADEDEALRLRIGVHASEPNDEDDDLLGTALMLAGRISGRAAGGEILVSMVVRELVAGKGFIFGDRGEVTLRGFDEPAHLYEVRWGSGAG